MIKFLNILVLITLSINVYSQVAIPSKVKEIDHNKKNDSNSNLKKQLLGKWVYGNFISENKFLFQRDYIKKKEFPQCNYLFTENQFTCTMKDSCQPDFEKVEKGIWNVGNDTLILKFEDGKEEKIKILNLTDKYWAAEFLKD